MLMINKFTKPDTVFVIRGALVSNTNESFSPTPSKHNLYIVAFKEN